MSLLPSLGSSIAPAYTPLPATISDQEEPSSELSDIDDENTDHDESSWELSEIDQKKLNFFEELESLIPEHSFFSSKEYDIYKTSLYTNTPLPLVFLAAKACARITKEQVKDMPQERYRTACLFLKNVRKIYAFAHSVLNASLHERMLHSDGTCKGLFSSNQSLGYPIPPSESSNENKNEENIDSPFTEMQRSYKAFINEISIEEATEKKTPKHVLSLHNYTKLQIGRKIEIPHRGITFVEEVVEFVLDDTACTQQNKGKFGDLGTGKWGFIGRGVREEVCDDEKEISIGTWGDTGDGSRDLTGAGYKTIFNEDGTLREVEHGIWGHIDELPENARTCNLREVWGLTKEGTITSYNHNGTIDSIETGTWGERGYGDWNLTREGSRQLFDMKGKIESVVYGIWTDLSTGVWNLAEENQKKTI